MGWKALLLETQLIARAIDGLLAPPAPQRKSATALLFEGLAVALAFVAALGLLYALWLGLDSRFAPETAAFYMGLSAAFLSILLFMGLWVARNRRKIKYYLGYKKVSGEVEGYVSSLLHELEEPVKQYPKTAALVAALVGAVLAEQIGKSDLGEKIFSLDLHKNLNKSGNGVEKHH